MVAAVLPKILLISDHDVDDVPGLSALIDRHQWQFITAPMADAANLIAEHSNDLAAAILLTPPTYYNGRQKDLITVLDKLVDRQVGALILTFNSHDLATAQRMCAADGLMSVPINTSPDELLGRLAALAALRPIIDQLQRENAMLRKYDTGLNTQFTQIDEEMRLAARLQSDFLPRTLPNFSGVSFNVLFRPASYVSGDIYDATRLDENHVAFFIADAVGHGMPAALLTIFLKRTLQTKEILPPEKGGGYRLIPPHEALAHLNNELVNQQLSLCQFVTMVYCILNTKTLELQWSRAGHPLPFHFKPNGSAIELELDGPLLGVFPDEVFELQKIQLSPGDSLLLYSDGFESAFPDLADPRNVMNTRYIDEFLKLAAPGPDSPTTRWTNLITTLDSQEGSLHQRDDLTALLLSIAAP